MQKITYVSFVMQVEAFGLTVVKMCQYAYILSTLPALFSILGM